MSMVIATADLSITEPSDVILLPEVAAYATAISAAELIYLSKKRDREIDRTWDRKLKNKYGVQYVLLATIDGDYPYSKNGDLSTVYLEKGQVWKIGETIRWDSKNRKQYRYSESWLRENNLKFIAAYEGTQGKIKIAEKKAIYTYYFRHGHLPPGNRIFR